MHQQLPRLVLVDRAGHSQDSNGHLRSVLRRVGRVQDRVWLIAATCAWINEGTILKKLGMSYLPNIAYLLFPRTGPFCE